MSCDKINDEDEYDVHPDGDALWEEVTRDIKPLKGRLATKIPKGRMQAVMKGSLADRKSAQDHGAPPADPGLAHLDGGFSGALKPFLPNVPDASSQQIDRSTADKLRKGQIPIEASIDLHGLYQIEARQRLLSFIDNAYHRRLRCVLVVTGKGKLILEDHGHHDERTPGVIKRNFKNWLAQEPYASMILKIQSAHIKDGGKGAYYILLRKKR